MKSFYPDQYDEECRQPGSFVEATKAYQNLEGCSLTIFTGLVRLMTLWNFQQGDAWSVIPISSMDGTTNEWIKLLGIAQDVALRQVNIAHEN